MLASPSSDILVSVNILVQVTGKTFTKGDVKSTNRVVKHGLDSVQIGLSYLPTDRENLHMVDFSNVSFSTNRDGSSKFGFITLLLYGCGYNCVLSFSSWKSMGAVRSVLVAEIFAFVESTEQALLLLHDLTVMLGKEVPVCLNVQVLLIQHHHKIHYNYRTPPDDLPPGGER